MNDLIMNSFSKYLEKTAYFQSMYPFLRVFAKQYPKAFETIMNVKRLLRPAPSMIRPKPPKTFGGFMLPAGVMGLSASMAVKDIKPIGSVGPAKDLPFTGPMMPTY